MGQSYEWAMDFRSGEAVDENTYYGFFSEQGMARVGQGYVNKNANLCFQGAELINLSQGRLHQSSTLKMAKRLLRLALRPIIGYKPLQARELLKQFRQLS